MVTRAKPAISPQTLVDFWDTLRRQPKAAAKVGAGGDLFRTATNDGWVTPFAIENYLVEVGAMPAAGKVTDVLAAFGIMPRSTFGRPRHRQKAAWGYERVEAIDLADFLIQIERLGFGVDPAPLCAALRPNLLKLRYLTGAQLAAFWHARERHRMSPIILRPDHPWKASSTESLTTRTGYRADLWLSDEGETCELWVHAPRYRYRSGSAKAEVFA